jgi:uncharacterized membrane protein (DUF2068 family)
VQVIQRERFRIDGPNDLGVGRAGWQENPVEVAFEVSPRDPSASLGMTAVCGVIQRVARAQSGNVIEAGTRNGVRINRVTTKGRSADDSFLLVIAGFKFVKGLALVAASCGAITLFHKNVSAHVGHWLNICGIDPDNRFVSPAVEKLGEVHTKQLAALSAIGLCYAALFLTEGTGLVLRQYWAEWLTVIATASLLPLEIYHIVHGFSGWKVALFVVNVVIVVYLIYRIRGRRARR